MSGNVIGIIIESLVTVLVVLGTVIILISALGVMRLPDVYTRAHATTKSSTLGLLCILSGTFIHFLYSHELISIRLLLTIIFVFLTAPVAGHLIIRSAHRASVPLADMNVQDVLQDDLELLAAKDGRNKAAPDSEPDATPVDGQAKTDSPDASPS